MARSEQQLSLQFDKFDDPILPFEYRALRLCFDDQRLEAKRRDPDPGLRNAWNAMCAEYLHKLGGMGAAW